MKSVAVIDYGMGNLRSVSNAMAQLEGISVLVTSDPDHIREADYIILPGVGALQDCMNELQRLGLSEIILSSIKEKPFLGICLGMQALLQESEENGGTAALGLIRGRAIHFSYSGDSNQSVDRLKVPHMGWNTVHQEIAHPLWHGIPQDSRFYFVHSYYVVLDQVEYIAGTTEYGHSFVSALARKNIFAVQFHPEKSQTHGLALLKNFVHWDGGL